MSYKVTAPLVVIANDDGEGGDWYGYADAIVPEGLNDERCKVLADEGFLEKVKAPKADASSDEKSDKVNDILKDVGDDKEKAQAALDTEKAKGDDARPSLVSKLEAIVSA